MMRRSNSSRSSDALGTYQHYAEAETGDVRRLSSVLVADRSKAGPRTYT